MRRFIMRDTHAPSPLLLRGAQNTGGSSSGLRLEKLAKVFVVAFVGIVVLRYALIGAEQDMKRALHTKLDAAVSWPDASGGDCGGEPRAQRRGGHGRARASGRARSERSVHRDAFTYSVAVMTYPGRTNRIQMLERTVRRIAFETPNSVEIIIFSGTEEDDEMLELVDVLCDSIIAGTGRGNGDEDMFRHDDAGKCRVEGILIPPIDAYLDEGVSSDRRDLRTNANYWNILKTLSARPPWSSWEGFVVVEDDVWLASGFHEILRWYANSMISSLSQPFLSHVHARAVEPLYDEADAREPVTDNEMWGSPDTPSNRGKQFMLSLYNPEMKRYFPTDGDVNRRTVKLSRYIEPPSALYAFFAAMSPGTVSKYQLTCLQYARYSYGTQGLFFSHRRPLADDLQQFFVDVMNRRRGRVAVGLQDMMLRSFFFDDQEQMYEFSSAADEVYESILMETNSGASTNTPRRFMVDGEEIEVMNTQRRFMVDGEEIEVMGGAPSRVPRQYMVWGLPFSLVQHMGISSSLFNDMDRFHYAFDFIEDAPHLLHSCQSNAAVAAFHERKSAMSRLKAAASSASTRNSASIDAGVCNPDESRGIEIDESTWFASIRFCLCMEEVLGTRYLALDDAIASAHRMKRIVHAKEFALSRKIDIPEELMKGRLERAVKQYQSLLDEVTCAASGSGIHGGYCLDTEASRAKYKDAGSGLLSNQLLDRGFAIALGDIFAGMSVVDIGAGYGQYGHFFDEAFTGPRRIRYIGVDGAQGVEAATDGFVRSIDVALPAIHDESLRSDWVMSIEVAEHIDHEDGEAIFLYNLDNLNTRGVVLSWAREGQFGHGHVNERNEDYVLCVMQLLGYDYDEEQSIELRAAVSTINACCNWLEQSVYVFTRGSRPRYEAFARFSRSFYGEEDIVLLQQAYLQSVAACPSAAEASGSRPRT